MAKKIPKRSQNRPEPPKMGTSNKALFIMLLTPWIVMGLVALVLSGTDLKDYEIIVISLFAALVTTFFIGKSIRQRRFTSR